MAKKSIDTEPRRDQGGRFSMGNIGGPGRPKGSRNKLAEKFIDASMRRGRRMVRPRSIAWQTESPAKYCALMTDLIPQHFKVEHEQTLTLSENELRAKLLEIRAKLLDSDVDPALLGPPLEEQP
jgi:hypothetical protein